MIYQILEHHPHFLRNGIPRIIASACGPSALMDIQEACGS